MKRLTERDEFGNADIIGVDGMDLQCSLEFYEFSKVANALNKLAEYEDLEEQGKLLKLPCAVGDTVYCIYSRYTKCSESNQEFDEYSCQGCEAEECDSKKEYYAQEQKAYSLDWIVTQIVNKHFGELVFLTQEAAEAALKEMSE